MFPAVIVSFYDIPSILLEVESRYEKRFLSGTCLKPVHMVSLCFSFYCDLTMYLLVNIQRFLSFSCNHTALPRLVASQDKVCWGQYLRFDQYILGFFITT